MIAPGAGKTGDSKDSLEKGIDGEVKPSEGWRSFAEAPGVDSNGGVRDGGMGGGGMSRESNTSDEQRETMM